MAGFFVFVVSASLIAFGRSQTGYVYQLDSEYSGANFFNGWDFFTASDPTGGLVTYYPQSVAQSQGLINASASSPVYLGVDYQNVIPSYGNGAYGAGRPSVRISTQKSWTHGLFIGDFAHAPGGICGTWPAWWTIGPNWPNNGEIDIMEGVNQVMQNAMSLHASPACSIAGDMSAETGQIQGTDCAYYVQGGGNGQGCGVADTRSSSYGTGFNAIGGGVYAMQWTSQYIRVWFFPRNAIPADITNLTPNPASWGLPAGNLQGSCTIDQHFQSHKIIFDNTFCGSYAGVASVWNSTVGSCLASTGYSTCNGYVAANPAAFRNSYWLVNSVRVYQLQAAGTSSSASPYIASNQPTATASASSTSSVAPVPSASYCPTYNFTVVQAGQSQYEVICGYNYPGSDIGLPPAYSANTFETCIGGCNVWNAQQGPNYCVMAVWAKTGQCYLKRSTGTPSVQNVGFNVARLMYYGYPQTTDNPNVATTTTSSTSFVSSAVTPQTYSNPSVTTGLATQTSLSSASGQSGIFGVGMGGSATLTQSTYVGAISSSSSSSTSAASTTASSTSIASTTAPSPTTTTQALTSTSSSSSTSTSTSQTQTTSAAMTATSHTSSSIQASTTSSPTTIPITTTSTPSSTPSTQISTTSSIISRSSSSSTTPSTTTFSTSSAAASTSPSTSISHSTLSVATTALSSSSTTTTAIVPPTSTTSSLAQTTTTISATVSTTAPVASTSAVVTTSSTTTTVALISASTTTSTIPASTTTTSIPETSFTGQPAIIDGYRYTGCLGNPADLSAQGTSTSGFRLVEDSMDMSIEQCIADCFGSFYIALFTTSCYCGDSTNAINAYQVYPDGECSIACPGDATEECGGVIASVGGSFGKEKRQAQQTLLTVYANDELVPPPGGPPGPSSKVGITTPALSAPSSPPSSIAGSGGGVSVSAAPGAGGSSSDPGSGNVITLPATIPPTTITIPPTLFPFVISTVWIDVCETGTTQLTTTVTVMHCGCTASLDAAAGSTVAVPSPSVPMTTTVKPCSCGKNGVASSLTVTQPCSTAIEEAQSSVAAYGSAQAEAGAAVGSPVPWQSEAIAAGAASAVASATAVATANVIVHVTAVRVAINSGTTQTVTLHSLGYNQTAAIQATNIGTYARIGGAEAGHLTISAPAGPLGTESKKSGAGKERDTWMMSGLGVLVDVGLGVVVLGTLA